ILARVLQMPYKYRDGALGEIAALEGAGTDAYERAIQAVEKAIAPIGKQKMQGQDAGIVVEEYECAADMLHHACGLGLLAHEDDPKVARPLRRKLAANIEQIIADYETLWQTRNRPGGLSDSAGRLRAIQELYQAPKRRT